jgi:hypothetical protein
LEWHFYHLFSGFDRWFYWTSASQRCSNHGDCCSPKSRRSRFECR